MRIVFAACLVTRIASADPASYGVQHTGGSGTPVWRDSRLISLALDTSTIPDQDVPAIAAAFDAWQTATASCGGVTFGLARANVPGLDSRQTIHVRTDRWCAPDGSTCYTPGAASTTKLTFIDDPEDPDDGKVVGTDVELNAVDFELLLPGQAPATTKPALDLQSVMTHEAGHVLGLDHDCAVPGSTWPHDDLGRAVPACDAPALPEAVLAATMYYQIDPGDLGARTPKASDIAGACALLAKTPEPEVLGGCSAGSGGTSAATMLAAGALLRRRRK